MKKLLILLLVFIKFNATSQLNYPSIYNDMYYKAYINFSNNENEYKSSKYKIDFLEAFGNLYSFTGNYGKSIEYFNFWLEDQGYIPDSLLEVELLDYGVSQQNLNDLYKKYNVIMFNESHHFSQHRAFLYSQLKHLKSLGFNQLALETLNKKDTTLNKRKYPIKKTGFYTNDPVFGNLIRNAIKLGFKLIPYDTKNKKKEYGQAENIFKQYKPKIGKLIVFGGYGHIAENKNMMGQYFKEMINEDILSISQFTSLKRKPNFPFNDGFEFYLQKEKTNYFDYFFYTKPKPSNKNIPYWYKWMNFQTIPLNKIYNKLINYPTLVQLHNINEKDAVPLYQYMIEKEEDVLIAYPKDGNYILKIIDKNGESEYKVKF